jgi:hypothetical protein
VTTAAYSFAEEISWSESTVTSRTPSAYTFALRQSQTASDATTQLLSFWSFSILLVHVQLFAAFHSLQIFAPVSINL